MKVPEILFWVIVGVLVGALLILIANEMLINVLKVNVQFNNQNPQTPTTIDCSTFAVKKDCEDGGCKWCPKCNTVFRKTNQWDADKCTDYATRYAKKTATARHFNIATLLAVIANDHKLVFNIKEIKLISCPPKSLRTLQK
jgi:Na+-transporting NADH:ubiquinone oxidoreductase subunit NqrF